MLEFGAMRYRTRSRPSKCAVLSLLCAAGCQGPRPTPPEARAEAPAVAAAVEPAPAAPLTGAAAAEADITSGQLVLRRYGFPSPWQNTYKTLLAERHGVRLDDMAGCVVTAELIDDVREYNRRMEAEIASRFGAEALRDVQAEAKRRWRVALPPQAGAGGEDTP